MSSLRKKPRIFISSFFVIFCLALVRFSAMADWETGARFGYDSNIDRTLTDEISSSYESAYISFSRAGTSESRLNWFITAAVEGTVYNKTSDLNSGDITIVPGLYYIPHRLISVTIAPFFQVKAVKDNDRNAVSLGGKITLREQLHSDIYLSQYFLYRNYEASLDTYSYEENAVGLIAGFTLTPRFSAEIAYEYSTSDSYQIISVGNRNGNGGGGPGPGPGPHNVPMLTIKEPVDRHAVGLNLNFTISKSLFSFANCTYMMIKGKSDNSSAYFGNIGVGYRF